MKEILSNLFKSFVTGVERRWREGLTGALGVAGAIWLITEMTTRVSESADVWLSTNGDLYALVVLVAGVIWFVAYSYEPRSVRFRIPTTDIAIEIRFGNLFSEGAHWLIGVNEFFDSDLGQKVAQTSLHGQFISNVYGGDSIKFRADVDAALASFSGERKARHSEPSSSYAIGTTAVLRNGSHNVFLVAMAKTDLTTDKASTDVSHLWTALRGAFQSIHDYSNGTRVAIPLVGNGPSNVNIEPQHLLRLIVLALVDFGRKVGLPKQVSIVVPEACFEQLDLREIKRDWKKT